MLTLTEQEAGKIKCNTTDAFRANIHSRRESINIGGYESDNSMELFYYMWVLNRWYQDKFINHTYNNFATEKDIQAVYARVKQII